MLGAEVTLVLTDDWGGPPREIRFPDAPTEGGTRRMTIGRSPDCDLALDDPGRTLSRRHLELDRSRDGLTATDVSLTGSWLGGGRMPLEIAVPVDDGDVIAFSHFRLTVRVAAGRTAGPAAGAAPGAAPTLGARPGLALEVRVAGAARPAVGPKPAAPPPSPPPPAARGEEGEAGPGTPRDPVGEPTPSPRPVAGRPVAGRPVAGLPVAPAPREGGSDTAPDPGSEHGADGLDALLSRPFTPRGD